MKIWNARRIAILGILVAVHIILSRFASINTWNLKIGFSFVPVFIAASLMGPLAGALVGGLGDFLGAILFPIGPYFPGITLSCALAGLLYGLLLYPRQTLPRILGATLLSQFGISLFLTTLWISMLNGAAYWPLFLTRIPQALLLSVVEGAVLLALSRAVAPRLRRLRLSGGLHHDR